MGDRKMAPQNLTATIEKEECAFVSRCPELEVASLGETPEEALENLKEAVELYLENAEELCLIDSGDDSPFNRSQTFSRF
jgi:predicted RNase H-like HicB family nuclease